MKMDIILLAVPFFFLLIIVELIMEKVRGTSYYRMSDSLMSLSTGSLSELTNALRLLVPFTVYVFIFDHFAAFQVPTNPLSWVVVFVVYDFCYYWKHRFGHEMNIMWAAHVVHHSSEEFNLSTALRQTSGSNIGFVFYLPLAVIGVDPAMLVTVAALNLVYQYWVHTQHIGRLGWAEWVFVTPSNHRGHHAQNTVYIDRNYGGVFIVWDRLFGSYQAELDHDKPVFGVRGALKSWNPVWANFQVFHQLWMDCVHTASWWYRLTIWFRRTGWRPPDVIDDYPLDKIDDLDQFEKFDIALSGGEKAYALVQYLLNATLGLVVLLNLDTLSIMQQLLIIMFITVSSYSTGAILERRPWVMKFELAKYCVLLVCGITFEVSPAFTGFACAFALVSLLVYALWQKGVIPGDSPSLTRFNP